MTALVAFVGATGGTETTRVAIETAATLARDGRRVVVVDTNYATQPLARYVTGRIDTDLTAVCADGTDTAAATYELAGPLSSGGGDRRADTTPELAGDDSDGGRSADIDGGRPVDATDSADEWDVPGSVVAVPARAPFERLVRAKTTDAARRLGAVCADLRERADHVLLSVPPVAANQHVAAVEAVDRVVAVAPGTDRGADGLRRLRDRLADLDTATDAVAATGTERDADATTGDGLAAADATLPDTGRPPTATPAALGDDESAAATVAAVETLLDVDTGVTVDTDGALDGVRRRLSAVGGRGE
ncbi:ParA family protein [Halobaculum sp. MBLA0147]|uniref:ParA family protein n=1 Tax=Halobaculum sp. MBLA0147 TaxID=3079934 RepID=UPI00352455D1